MSWFNRFTQISLVCLCSLVLTACFRPLNGSFGKNSGSVAAQLAQIDIESTSRSEVLNHYLTEDLRFEFNGGNPSKDIRYKLKIYSSDGLTVPVIESSSGRAEIGSVVTSVQFALTQLDPGKVIGSGTVSSSATFDRMSQRFSSARARRDAQIRDAQNMAEQLRTRIAALFMQNA